MISNYFLVVSGLMMAPILYTCSQGGISETAGPIKLAKIDVLLTYAICWSIAGAMIVLQ